MVAAALAAAPLKGEGSPPPPSPAPPAAQYAHGYGLLMTVPYAAVVRVGTTRHGASPGDASTDVLTFDTSATTGGFSISDLRPWPFGDVPVSRVIGTGGRLYLQIDGEPRSVVDDDLPRSAILFGRGSPLFVPPPDALGDYVPVPYPAAGRRAFRATVETGAARRVVAEVLVGAKTAERVASRLAVRSAAFRAVVDEGTGRLVVTQVHIDAWVPPDAFADVRVPKAVAAYAGHRMTVASRFDPIALPGEPDVGVPDRTMPVSDWIDTLDVRARLVEAAAAVSLYRDTIGSLRGLTPRRVRGFDPSLRLVRGRGTTGGRTVGSVAHPDRHGFTLRTTARNGWTYRLDSSRHGHLVGTCRMAARRSCGVWLRG